MKAVSLPFLAICIHTMLVNFLPFAKTEIGVDVSSAVSVSAWTCLKNQGYNFAVVRTYRSLGIVDSNAANTIKNARAAGISSVDAYIFPCFKCEVPRCQVQMILANLKRNNATIGQIWIDVESAEYWGPTATDNVNFIQELIQELVAKNIRVGLYTNNNNWNPITSNSKVFGFLPVWYAHWDNKTNFDSFKTFGGWTSPAMKQFLGNVNVCGVNIDKDWRP